MWRQRLGLPCRQYGRNGAQCPRPTSGSRNEGCDSKRRLVLRRVEHDGAFLARLSASRRRGFELIAGAIVLSFGVNLLASYVNDRATARQALAAGAIATVGGLVVLAWRAIWPSPRERSYSGFIICDIKTNRLIAHPRRYRLAHDVEQYIASAFAENDALRAAWDRHPLAGNIGARRDASRVDNSKSLEIVRQATEYFVMSHLSTHLTDYFNTSDFEQSELEAYSHTDIPDVLLQNRFMKLFAEPMEERVAFGLEGERPHNEGWTTVLAYGAGGALYERFELVLPKGGRVARVSPTRVRVSTKRFSLDLSTEVSGFRASLPVGYEEVYLGLGPSLDDEGRSKRASFEVRVGISIVPSRHRLLSPVGWRYYRWIDEWLEALKEATDAVAYAAAIGYETAYTAYVLSRSLPGGAMTDGSSRRFSVVKVDAQSHEGDRPDEDAAND
jgi:hypothetical protein